jgi:hypothetical protein
MPKDNEVPEGKSDGTAMKRTFREAFVNRVKELRADDPGYMKKAAKEFLAEFDRRPDTGTYHGFFELLEHFEHRLEIERPDEPDTDDFPFLVSVMREHFRESQLSRGIENFSEFKINVCKGDLTLEAGMSKLGGEPEMLKDLDIPVCPECDKNMSLFIQLDDIGRFPQPIGTGDVSDYSIDGVGIFYVFKCPDCSSLKAFSSCHD